MKTLYLLLGIVGVLVLAAFLVPSNSLTGHVVQERSCGSLGCSELCDAEDVTATCSMQGTVCCPTHWETGVCDYEVNCEKIREYSLYQSLATYQDSVREQPAPVTADWRSFFLPLLLVLGIIAYFIFKRDER